MEVCLPPEGFHLPVGRYLIESENVVRHEILVNNKRDTVDIYVTKISKTSSQKDTEQIFGVLHIPKVVVK